ncbi:MAG: leucine-rich repeat protein [Lachnospiraceae bacterium]|nr:leucine-rich repeat protein [Lachnospiraceae bacterium]
MKKRKILSFMLTLCLLFQTILSDAVPVLAAPEDEAGFSLEETDAGEDPFPEEEEIGENEADGLEYGDFVYTSNSSGVTITGYKGTDTAVVIPSVIDEKDVIAIKEAFKDNTVIESVTVPGSVLTIGQNSFYGCTALSEVHLPDTLTEIARNAFYNAHSLASVDLPDGLKTIGNYAFQNCSALTAVTLPAALESVGEGAFKGSALASILIPAGLTSIGSNAFMTVTEMSFEAGTVKIPAKAASGADQLSSLSIPSSVTEIGESAFLNCSSLTAVTLPDGLVKIGASAFKGSGISEFTLPATLTSIDSGALQPAKRLIFAPGTTTVAFSCFKSDTYLESVSFPDTLESIGKEEFKGCKGLTELVIPAGVHVNVSAFENCTGLKKVELGDNVIVDTAAFKGCSSIESIRRGNNVTIAAGAFEGGQGAVPGSNVWYSHSAASGILVLSGIGSMPDFDDPSEAPWAGLRDQITTVRIEEGVTTVGAKAFYGCSNLQYVSFPKGLESIGREAFAACPELCEIIFAGDAPRFGSNVFKDSGTASGCIKAYYPKTATGWGNGYQKLSDLIRWEAWDDTLSSSDIILVLDRSDSMSGKKIAKLREAACKFIDVVGGKKMNTRIAVVMYNGGASVLSEFTDENGPLMDLVDGLDATGGTNYLKALTVAEDLMKSSDADHKFIIMFSDGQPNDSEDAIYEKADALREQYTIFTVGLMSGGSSDDRYRQILINVAGDENHYFEVDDLELLVSTFQNLSNDVKRQDETTAEIIRHNLRKDLLNDHVEFTEGSQEVASISVIPGLKLGSYDHVDLLSNNKVVLSSVNGYFNGIKPGCIFAPGASVYGVIYDSKGKELQRVRLGLEITGKYTITYQMNDGTGDVYLTQEVTGGELIPEPDAPEWDGHRFMGWYTSVSGSGLDFFSMYNSFNRMKLEEDLVLYAHWTAADGSLDIKKDVWGFSDSSASFASDDYEISYGEYAELLASVKDPVTKQLIKEIKTHKWSGSSFGMSSAVVLNKEGFINITEYDATCLYLRQAELLLNTKGDQDAGDIESMITYFQLRKALEYVNSASLEFLPDKESNNIAHIVEKLRETAGPCVLIVGMSSGNTPVGTHAVVAYDYSEGIGSESSFKVYDCTKGADKVYTVRVSRSGSDYSADTTAWASDWGYKIFLQCVLDGDELTRGEDPAGRSFQADAAVLPGYYLETSYGSFTVSNGSESAVFVNGLKTSGDLEAEGFGICSEPGAAKQYKVKLPLLAEGKSYTISDASGATVYETLAYDYEGFLVKVSAASAGTVKFDASGRVETVFTTAVSQKVGTGISGMNTSWYHAEVECVSKGLTLVPEKTGVSFSSAAAATAQVTASGDIRDHVFTDVALGTDALTLTEKDGKTVILDKNGNRVASDDSGFTVVFDSRHGSYVDRIEGVMSGEKIAEPMDPRRDGFLFTGWYRDPYCSSSQLWDFERDTVTEDMILYAGWTLDENYYLIVTFRMKGEDAHLLYLLKGTKLTQESCPKAADGTVLKWYSDPGCTSEWDFDQTLDRNTELYSVDWNSGSRTEGDVPESEIPEGGIPNGVWVASIPAQEYTGKALKPSVHVYYYKKALIEGRDYTLSYKNNKRYLT